MFPRNNVPPRPLCTCPQLMTDGSTSEGHLCPWAGKKSLHSDEKCSDEACVSNASHLCCCLWDRWTHLKRNRAQLKIYPLTFFLFSPHAWQHLCTFTSWTIDANRPVWQVGLDEVSYSWSSTHLRGFSFLCHTIITWSNGWNLHSWNWTTLQTSHLPSVVVDGVVHVAVQ